MSDDERRIRSVVSTRLGSRIKTPLWLAAAVATVVAHPALATTQEPVPQVSASHRLLAVAQRTGGIWEATYRLTLANTGQIGLATLRLRLIDAIGVPLRPGQTGPSVGALAPGESIVTSWKIQTLAPVDAESGKRPLVIHGEATDDFGEACGVGIFSNGEARR
jgi:hypothetical protein